MKQALSLILSVVILTALLTGCQSNTPTEETEQVPDRFHTLYYKDDSKSDTAVATFFNSATGESEDVTMDKIGEDSDCVTFSCEGDCAAYNMVYVTCGDEKATAFTKVAFNHCTSGWHRTESDLLPYTQGEDPDYYPACDEASFTCKDVKKRIRIWTPDDYDPASDETYSTVYLLDGQEMLPDESDATPRRHSPMVTEQVKAMTANTGKKAIVVAINSNARDYEMVPEIGDSFDEKMHRQHNDGEELSDVYDTMNGSEFARFVADTVVPYIREHYRVYDDAGHTAVSGYSLGGLEAFYMTVEYPDVFGTVGAMSPSFWEFDDKTWNAYLGEKSFDDNAPFLYLYTGSKSDTDPFVTQMYERLKTLGYPEDKLALHYNEEGLHDGRFWRNVFPEFLEAAVYGRIAPLQ